MRYTLFLIIVGLSWGVQASAQAMPSDLVEAYKKEFAFLKAQKEALRKRHMQFDRHTQTQLHKAETALRRLQGSVQWMQNKAETLQQQWQDVEKTNAQKEEIQERFQKATERAAFTLSELGYSTKSAGKSASDVAAQWAVLMEQGQQWMQRGRSITKKEGSFFLENGQETKGQIVQIGQIASYAKSAHHVGALAPAGSLRLKLWPENAKYSAQQLMSGLSPKQLQIFLYEDLQKEIKRKQEKGFLEEVDSGGLIAWVIVGLGAFALFLILLRCLFLLLATSRTQALLQEIEPLLAKQQFEQARAVCARSRGAAARVLQKTLAQLGAGLHKVEDTVVEAVLAESPAIERFGVVITVCAAIAPLLGLLGTVTGMISTFDVITQYGTGDPKMLAGGISEALITTKLGLVVAIPTLLIGSLLSGRAESLLSQMEWAALRVINLSERARLQTPVFSPTPNSMSLPVVETELPSPVFAQPTALGQSKLLRSTDEHVLEVAKAHSSSAKTISSVHLGKTAVG